MEHSVADHPCRTLVCVCVIVFVLLPCRLSSASWFADHEHIDTVKTSNVIPADLNAILYRVELALAELHAVVRKRGRRERKRQRHTAMTLVVVVVLGMLRQVGDSTHSSQYSAAASSRATAMRSVLWDEVRRRGFTVML